MASTKLQVKGGAYRAEMDEAERASRDEIMALQTSAWPGRWRMPTTMSRITKRRSTKPACIPSDFRQLSDLAKFPFTVKTDLRDNYPFNMFAVPRESWSASTPRPAPPASRSWSAIPGPISTCGRM